MNIDFPTAVLIPQLRSLWKAAFGDDDDYLNLFFSTAFSSERCRCITEDGTVLAALYWFDVRCDDAPMAYLYAVATDPAARNRGLCRTLIGNTLHLLSRQGYAGVLLNPADEGLDRMYGRMGFEPCTTVSEAVFEAGTRPVRMKKIEMDEYARLRRSLLPPHGVIQEGAMLDFLNAQADFYRGDHFLAAISVYDGKLHCHELLGDTGAASGILRSLCFSQGFFRFPGVQKTFTRLYPLCPDCPVPGYFGLSLG